MDIKFVIYFLIAFFILKKVSNWSWYFIKRGQNYVREKELLVRRQDRTFEFEQVPQPIKESILACDTIQELLKGQYEGTFSCKQLISVYWDRAYKIGRKLRISADECFRQALQSAEDKDKELKQCLSSGSDPYKVLGKLHGIPFSVKDQIKLKEYLSTLGVGSLSENIAKVDANIVAVFKKQGGIPIVKGNTPTIWLSLHSTNRIFGCARNPWNHKRTCGGSSGGDAAMLASQCAQFSIGSDLGGSLRAPASFWGVNVFLPTSNRQSADGNLAYFKYENINMNPIRTVIGPFARNIDDLTTLMQVYFSKQMLELEPNLPQIEFKEDLYKETLSCKHLKIGIIKDLETVMAYWPTAKRALVEAQAHLESLGHEFIEIEIPSIEDQFQNHMKLMMNENLNLIAENWDERCDDLENVGNLLLLYRSSPMIANTISKIAKLFDQRV